MLEFNRHRCVSPPADRVDRTAAITTGRFGKTPRRIVEATSARFGKKGQSKTSRMLPHGSSVEVQPAKVPFELCGYFFLWGGHPRSAGEKNFGPNSDQSNYRYSVLLHYVERQTRNSLHLAGSRLHTEDVTCVALGFARGRSNQQFWLAGYTEAKC